MTIHVKYLYLAVRNMSVYAISSTFAADYSVSKIDNKQHDAVMAKILIQNGSVISQP